MSERKKPPQPKKPPSGRKRKRVDKPTWKPASLFNTEDGQADNGAYEKRPVRSAKNTKSEDKKPDVS